MRIFIEAPGAVFLIMCDSYMNKLRATLTGLCIYLNGFRVAHSSFIEGSHMTKNTASDFFAQREFCSYKLLVTLRHFQI